MKRFALLIATLGFFSACNSSDSIITCDRYDQWMASCSNCSMTISCENNYDSLAPTVQVDLDDCADNVLMNNLGVCGDWTGDVQYCIDLGYDYLGITCFDYWCGDGFCDHGETAGTCPADCGTGPVCGNGVCETGEDEISCAADCYVPECGDGVCEAGENEVNCAVDCVVVECGDGICDDVEDPVDCPLDCAYLVCDDYQDWLEGCFADCTALESCDDEYGVLDPATAEDVWDCAMFLADAAFDGLCADNINGVCDVLLEEELGSFGDCTF